MDETSFRTASLFERLQMQFGRRAMGFGLALALELLLLLALLSLSQSVTPPGEPVVTEVDLAAKDFAEPAPEEPQPEPEQPRPDAAALPEPSEAPAPLPQPALAPAVVIPIPTAPPSPPAAESAPPVKPGVRLGPAQGPPNTAPSSSSDPERVGTAPNGEPLYAARWYREPGDEIRGYFSEASPGWGLIACRTIPNFYVTDCVPLGESQGSRLNRSMLAASGQFRVRPPRLGGQVLVGSWVRIRFDYTLRRE